jgi:hypothetical protein
MRPREVRIIDRQSILDLQFFAARLIPSATGACSRWSRIETRRLAANTTAIVAAWPLVPARYGPPAYVFSRSSAAKAGLGSLALDLDQDRVPPLMLTDDHTEELATRCALYQKEVV